MIIYCIENLNKFVSTNASQKQCVECKKSTKYYQPQKKEA